MKRIISTSIIVFAVALLAPQITTAQGTTTFLSNLGQSSAGSNSVGSESWVAAGFYSGNNANGYFLNSVQLSMTDSTGNPSGFTVMLYANGTPTGVVPGSSLGTLTGSTDPATAGTYTYTAPSSLSLSPQTQYYIVVTAGTSVGNGAYEWSYAGANNYNPSGAWSSSGAIWTSSNGSSWATPTGGYLQFALDATPVPEPGVLGLFALGGLLVGFLRWKAGKV